MTHTLFAFSLLAFIAGGLTFFYANTAIHEIEAFILILIAAVLVSSAGIIDAIHFLREKLSKGADQ